MMKYLWVWIILTLVFTVGPTSFGAVIFVDGQLPQDCTGGNYSITNRNDSGADGDAYNTLQEAHAVTNPGDTIYIRAGTYRELTSTASAKAPLEITRSGTAGNVITYSNYNGEEVIVDAYNPGNGVRKYYAIEMGVQPSSSLDESGSGVSYITLTGLIVQGGSYGGIGIFGEADRVGDVTSPSQYVTVTHCVARNCVGVSAGGIRTIGTVLNCEIAFCQAYGNYYTGISYGYVAKGWHNTEADDDMSAARFCTIHDCIAYDNDSPSNPGNTDGISMANAYQCSMYDNVVFGNSDDGMDIYTSCQCTATGNIVFNHVHPLGNGCGIKFSAGGGGRHIIANNISYNNKNYNFEGSSPSNPQRPYAPSKIINNTGVGGARGVVGPLGAYTETDANFPKLYIRNNLFFNHSGQDIDGDNDYQDSDYNFVENAADLAGQRAAGNDVHSLTGDPCLANASLTMDVAFPAGWTIEQKLQFVRAQVRTSLAPLSNSGLIDGGAVVAGYHNATAGSNGGNDAVWHGARPDIGAVERTAAVDEGQVSDVTAGNHVPVMEPVGDRSIGENETLTFVVHATDADADGLTYSAANLPSGARFDSGTQMFTWTPVSGQVGAYNVILVVSDGAATASQIATITVTQPAPPEDSAPVLAAIDDPSVQENALLSFSLSASDADDDSLSFAAAGLPAGATFENGTFSWIPDDGRAGAYPVDFSVSDGRLTDSQRVTITVTPSQVVDRTAPSVGDCYPPPDEIQVSLHPLIAVTVSDAGSGVDANTVSIRIDGQVVYAGNRTVHETAYGTCRRTGTAASYGYSYYSADSFDFDQEVSVHISGSDRAGNAMAPVAYQFVTEMQSFGGNERVSVDGVSAGSPAVATDSQGNIWAAWHAGPANARDIYVARRNSQSLQWDSPVQLTDQSADQCNPAIAVGSNDAVYVVWQDNRRGNWDIYLSITQDGSVRQEPVVITESQDNQINPVIAVDHASPGRVYVAWEDDGGSNRDIYLAWSSSLFAGKELARITSDTADQTSPVLTMGSDDTVYLIWTDQRNGTMDIYGTSSNASSWANTPVATGSGNQSNPAIAVEPGTSRLHVLWVDDSSGSLDVLHGMSEGLPSSPVAGHILIDDTTSADQSAPAVVAARDPQDDTHVYACWQDSRTTDGAHDTDVYFVEIRSGSGGTNVLVGDDGANSGQSDPVMAFDAYGQPAIIWADDRGSTAQLYSACSTYVKPEVLASQTISPSTGGRVGTDPAKIVDSHDVSIAVPAAAYDCDTVLSISQIQNFRQFVAPCVAGFEIGPSGVQFSVPATVTIPYTNSASRPAIPYWYDARTGTLSQEGITEVSTTRLANGMSAVSFKTTHLTPYYVLEGPAGGEAVGGSSGGGCALASGANAVRPLDYVLPYVGVAIAMVVWRRRDRRTRRSGG